MNQWINSKRNVDEINKRTKFSKIKKKRNWFLNQNLNYKLKISDFQEKLQRNVPG